nr:integrase, catalytic region, zinc finger, CCHC-type, peptidase aspartic, catalytic [Tanacetum cinerariifolium]
MIGNLDPFIREHTQKRDPAVNIDWWLHARMVVLDHFMPFIDQFREGVYNFADILTKEINEFERLFDDLDAEYKKTFAELQTMLAQSAQEKKSSAKESKYEQLYIEQRDEFKKFAANFVELDKLHKSKVTSQNQLQEKDNVIKDLQKQISEMQVSRERSTEGRVKTQALETALSQLKAQLASAHIQLNSYKAENKTLSQRYEELAKSNMASREINEFERLFDDLDAEYKKTFAELQTMLAQSAQEKKSSAKESKVTGKQNSGSKSLAKPKVTATGMVSDTTKYIPPHQRLNRVAPTPYPTKKQVTFQGNPRQSSRPTPTRVVQQQRQPTIPNERRSSGNRDSYVVQNWKPVNRKTTTIKQVFQPVKQVVTPVKKVWKATSKVVQIVLWYLDSGCSRHMTGDRSKLINYVDKFIGTVRFRIDEFATIVG